MRTLLLSLVAVVPVLAGDVVSGSALSDPFALEADGRPIDLSDGTGHAAPLVVDWDGDGLKDLLVGQFAGGKLRIYRNVGAKGAPKLAKHEWFQAAGQDATVPTG
jgi:hypothetical protein